MTMRLDSLSVRGALGSTRFRAYRQSGRKRETRGRSNGFLLDWGELADYGRPVTQR